MSEPAIKPYLYADELATLTPWSVAAIRKKVQRGELKLGRHYFQEGRRGRLIFKWAAIVTAIENGIHPGADCGTAGPAFDGEEVIAIEEATERLRRLLG